MIKKNHQWLHLTNKTIKQTDEMYSFLYNLTFDKTTSGTLCLYIFNYNSYFYMVGRLKIYNSNIPRESIIAEREAVYLNKSAEQKFYALLHLNHISVKMNGGKPLKIPQGKGLVIRKPSI